MRYSLPWLSHQTLIPLNLQKKKVPTHWPMCTAALVRFNFFFNFCAHTKISSKSSVNAWARARHDDDVDVDRCQYDFSINFFAVVCFVCVLAVRLRESESNFDGGDERLSDTLNKNHVSEWWKTRYEYSERMGARKNKNIETNKYFIQKHEADGPENATDSVSAHR